MPTKLPTVNDRGIIRPLGHRPPRDGRNVSSAVPRTAIPRSQLVAFDLRTIVAPIKVKDQNGKGACNGHAAASVAEWARWLAGMTHVDLSAWMVYAILCNGIDNGSNIGDALTLMSKTGTCPDKDVAYGSINPRAVSAANRTAALQNRVEIGTKLLTFDDMLTSAALRRPFNFSLRASDNFGNLDSDGCIPVTPGVGNHAITGGLGLKQRKSNGEWLILWQNSWTTKWGDNGFAWVSEGSIKRQQYFEAYDVEAMVDSDGGNNPPPLI